MVKYNQALVNPHFHKQWDKKMLRTQVKTWFNQPAKKVARRHARAEKAKAIYPRPVSGSLRPLVRGMTQKYNSRVRFGRGFTLDELQKAGITSHFARTIGIAVDYRRRNSNQETLQANVQRLKLYKSKLVLFPRKASKPKKGDATAEELKTVTQQPHPFPFKVLHPKDKARVIDAKAAKESVYKTMRTARGAAAKVGWPIVEARHVEAGQEPKEAKSLVRLGAKRAAAKIKKNKK